MADTPQVPSIDTDLAAGQPPLTMAKAIAYVPPTARGPVSPTTIFRWVTKGINGIRLEGRRAPSGWFTTLGAIQRFYQALTEQSDQVNGRQAPRQSDAEIEAIRENEAAMERLRRKGLLRGTRVGDGTPPS